MNYKKNLITFVKLNKEDIINKQKLKNNQFKLDKKQLNLLLNKKHHFYLSKEVDNIQIISDQIKYLLILNNQSNHKYLEHLNIVLYNKNLKKLIQKKLQIKQDKN